MTNFDKNDWYQEAIIGLTLSAFIGTVALFFDGILIAQINTFKDSIRFPIVLLSICTISLIYSAIIYSNASGHVTTENWATVQKHNKYANLLSEFFGVNLFLISIPLVISALTSDLYIRVTLDVIVLVSLFIYTVSSFSMLSRMYSNLAKYTVSFLLVCGLAALLFTQNNNYHNFIAFGMVMVTIYTIWVMTLFPRNTNRQVS